MLTRRTVTAALVSLALPFGLSVPIAAQEAERLPDVVMGDENAPVEIVEYASMTCPHCKAFHEGTFKELKSEYIDTGKAKFILREFPFDPLAAGVFMLARCSGDNYYDVVDLFFERQAEWTNTRAENEAERPLAVMRKLALQAGFTDDSFRACLTDQKLLDGINAVKDHGYSEMGVRATPTIFVDGEKLDGTRDIRAFRDIIDPKLGG